MTIVANVISFVVLGWLAVGVGVYLFGAYRATHFSDNNEAAMNQYISDTSNYKRAISWPSDLYGKVEDALRKTFTLLATRFR